MIQIHTSDRISFKRCRRRWDFSSQLRQGLINIDGEVSPHLWFGSGIHYALEDYHGYCTFGNPFKAFQAYCWATRRAHPTNVKELVPLAEGMLSHYVDVDADSFNDTDTVWFDDNGQMNPAVEVYWEVPIPGFDPDQVVYAGTFDRLVTDKNEGHWILDYKTAQRFNTGKLEMDTQVTAYCWAFRQLYGYDPKGVIYIQMLKEVPSLPNILKNGDVSTNKAQATTFHLYKQALKQVYGELRNVPPKQKETALHFKNMEALEGDKFIRRDFVRRNSAQIDSETWKIVAETNDMLDEHVVCYPNPTKDCSFDCNFRGPCVAMDDGSDFQSILNNGYAHREEMHPWRKRLPTPSELEEILDHDRSQRLFLLES